MMADFAFLSDPLSSYREFTDTPLPDVFSDTSLAQLPIDTNSGDLFSLLPSSATGASDSLDSLPTYSGDIYDVTSLADESGTGLATRIGQAIGAAGSAFAALSLKLGTPVNSAGRRAPTGQRQVIAGGSPATDSGSYVGLMIVVFLVLLAYLVLGKRK